MLIGWQRHSRQDGGRQIPSGGGELGDCRAATGEEAGLLKEVGWRIAADGEFREDGEARTPIRGAAADSDDLLQIAGEIPNRGVDLGKCDLHSSSLYGGTGRFHSGRVFDRDVAILFIPMGPRDWSDMKADGS